MNLKYRAAFAAVGFCAANILYGGLSFGADFLSREEAIRLAIAAAPTLDAAKERINASHAGIKQADTKPNPTFTADFENFTGSGSFTGFNRSEVTLSYSQKFERGGKRNLRTALASEDKKIKIAEWHIRRLDLIAEIDKNYISAATAKARYENLKRQVVIYTEIKTAIQKRVKAGKDSNLAVQNAHIRLLGIQNKMAVAKQTLEVAKLSLASMWQGNPDAFLIDITWLSDLPSAMAPLTPETVEGGPDLTLWNLRQGLMKASLALEKSRAVQDPTFKVGVRYHQNSSDMAAIAGVSIPLAIHNTNRGNIGRAMANLNRSRFDSLEVERRLKRQLVMAHSDQTSAFMQVRQLRQNLAAAKEAKNMVMGRLSKGLASYLDVFSAQSMVTEIEDLRIAALANFHTAQVTIDRLFAKHDNNVLPPSIALEGTDVAADREGL